MRYSASADRRRALADAPRVLRLADPLQRRVWHYLLERVDRPVRTGAIARTVRLLAANISPGSSAPAAPPT